jgi:hypothetical protein
MFGSCVLPQWTLHWHPRTNHPDQSLRGNSVLQHSHSSSSFVVVVAVVVDGAKNAKIA